MELDAGFVAEGVKSGAEDKLFLAAENC